MMFVNFSSLFATMFWLHPSRVRRKSRSSVHATGGRAGTGISMRLFTYIGVEAPKPFLSDMQHQLKTTW